VDEFLRIPDAERRPDLYRTQQTIPDVHPDGYRGPGLNLRDSRLREGYDPVRLNPESGFIPEDSRGALDPLGSPGGGDGSARLPPLPPEPGTTVGPTNLPGENEVPTLIVPPAAAGVPAPRRFETTTRAAAPGGSGTRPNLAPSQPPPGAGGSPGSSPPMEGPTSYYRSAPRGTPTAPAARRGPAVADPSLLRTSIPRPAPVGNSPLPARTAPAASPRPVALDPTKDAKASPGRQGILSRLRR
jgi:hypothetical protein